MMKLKVLIQLKQHTYNSWEEASGGEGGWRVADAAMKKGICKKEYINEYYV